MFLEKIPIFIFSKLTVTKFSKFKVKNFKHFDCNYGTPHVPLDGFFGTHAAEKEDVRKIWQKENWTDKNNIINKIYLQADK